MNKKFAPKSASKDGLKQTTIFEGLKNLRKLKRPSKLTSMIKLDFNNSCNSECEESANRVDNENGARRKLPFSFLDDEDSNESLSISTPLNIRVTEPNLPPTNRCSFVSIKTPTKVTVLSNKIISPANTTNKSDNVVQTKDNAKNDSENNNFNGNQKEKTPVKICTIKNDTVMSCKKNNEIIKSPKKATPISSPKKEKKGINNTFLKLINELISTVFQSRHLSALLDQNDSRILKNIQGASSQYQFVCFKLYKWLPKWYKLSKFVDSIGLDLDDTEIPNLYDFLKVNDVVDTDYTKEETKFLLSLLDASEIKSLCSTFRIRRPQKTLRGGQRVQITNKEILIDLIMKKCITQRTLTAKKTKDLVHKEITKKLGMHVVKIKQNFRDAFHRVFKLATFTNPELYDIDNFLEQMMRHNVDFPEYEVKDCPVFYSRSELISYMKALSYSDQIYAKDVTHVEQFQMGRDIFNELKGLPEDNEDGERYKETPHLKRFTAQYVYVKCLNYIAEKLLFKFSKEARDWLEYLMERFPDSHWLADWYYNLSRVYNNLKNKEHSGNLLISALSDKKDCFTDIEIEKLGERGRFMKSRLDQLQHDILIKLLPAHIQEDDFPIVTVDHMAIRGNVSGRKRDYVSVDSEGNKIYKKVEDVALDYYLDQLGFTNGLHCEGSLIIATFALFFWDIIYNPEILVPGTFLSKKQFYPLDLFTPHFYLHRKQALDQRLQDIAENWSDKAVQNFAKQNWELYHHVTSFCTINRVIDNPKFLENIIECVGRRVLAKIFERLAKNIRMYRSGLPDLFIWDSNLPKAKFVEVKGEGDKLSINQKLWLKYLKSIGADVEVCRVHSIGSSKRVEKDEKLKKEKLTPKKNKVEKTKTPLKHKFEKTQDDSTNFNSDFETSSTTSTPKKKIKLDPQKKKKTQDDSTNSSLDFETSSTTSTPKKKIKLDPQKKKKTQDDSTNSSSDFETSSTTSTPKKKIKLDPQKKKKTLVKKLPKKDSLDKKEATSNQNQNDGERPSTPKKKIKLDPQKKKKTLVKKLPKKDSLDKKKATSNQNDSGPSTSKNNSELSPTNPTKTQNDGERPSTSTTQNNVDSVYDPGPSTSNQLFGEPTNTNQPNLTENEAKKNETKDCEAVLVSKEDLRKIFY